MADRPILFSGPMVRALLDGRKTQTRRVLKPQPPADLGLVGIYAPKLTAVFGYVTPDADCKVALRYAPGDLLWVRETWARTTNVNHESNWPGRPHLCTDPDLRFECIIWRADGPWEWCDEYGSSTERSYWKPGIHMPRWASRLTLEVTDVRVERIQDISEEDAKAEGVRKPMLVCEDDDTSYRAGFETLWNDLNAKRGFGWEANPWVTAITFRVHHANILLERAND